MICQKTYTQLCLEGLDATKEDGRVQKQSKPLPDATDFLAGGPKVLGQKEYHRRWRILNKDKIRKYSKNDWVKYREQRLAKRNTPEAIGRRKEWQKEYRVKRKDYFTEKNKEWHKKNAEHVKEYRRNYGERRRELYQKNREKILARKKEIGHRYRWRVQEYSYRKRRTDIQFCLAERLRATMRRALLRQFVEKSRRTFELVGCTPGEFRAYIESKFTDGMTWENRNKWHLDHIMPLMAFDLRDIEQQKKAFHYTNIQPLWAIDNIRKSDKKPAMCSEHTAGLV